MCDHYIDVRVNRPTYHGQTYEVEVCSHIVITQRVESGWTGQTLKSISFNLPESANEGDKATSVG